MLVSSGWRRVAYRDIKNLQGKGLSLRFVPLYPA